MTEEEWIFLFTTMVWKYGEAFVDNDEIEHHVMKVTEEESLNFGCQVLEVLHKEDASYYRVKRTI